MDGNQEFYQTTTKRRNTAGGAWVRVLVLAVIAVAVAGGFWLFERSPATPFVAEAPASQAAPPAQLAQSLTPTSPSNTGADAYGGAAQQNQPSGNQDESQRDQP